jgi:predicted Rossmann fold flavoprotein
MAAISAADQGIKSVVLEAMPKPALKLGISGKGRGNLTNTAQYSEFLKHFNQKGRFLKFCFKNFFNQELLDFFHHEGLKTNAERGGRIFTASGKATDAAKSLVNAASKRGVKILVGQRVVKIARDESGFKAITQVGRNFSCQVLLLATGGKSYPLTGSCGDGYGFGTAMGHKVTQLFPSLVALKPEKNLPGNLNGLLLKNIELQLRADGRKIAAEFGEMQFIDGYLGGATAITLSRTAVPLLHDKKQVRLCIDLKPALSHEKLDQRLLRDLKQLQTRPVKEMLAGLLPAPMVEFCAEELGISTKSLCREFSAVDRRKLRNWLKELCFDIVEAGPWSQAIVTAGGIDTGEINPQSMESRLVENLFFAGELIDIDADTGGYNLQAAFSTGWLAGRSAAMKLLAANS